MRLGDLDALKEEIVKLCTHINANKGITVPTLAFTRIIDNAPTVSDRYDEGYSQGYIDGSTGALERRRTVINITKEEIRDKMFFVNEENSNQLIAVIKVSDLLEKEVKKDDSL